MFCSFCSVYTKKVFLLIYYKELRFVPIGLMKRANNIYNSMKSGQIKFKIIRIKKTIALRNIKIKENEAKEVRSVLSDYPTRDKLLSYQCMYLFGSINNIETSLNFNAKQMTIKHKKAKIYFPTSHFPYPSAVHS